MFDGKSDTEAEKFLMMNGLAKAQGALERLRRKESKLDSIIRLSEIKLRDLDPDVRISIHYEERENSIIRLAEIGFSETVMKAIKSGRKFWGLEWSRHQPNEKGRSIYISKPVPHPLYPCRLIDASISGKIKFVPCIADIFDQIAENSEKNSELFDHFYEYESQKAVMFRNWIQEGIKEGEEG